MRALCAATLLLAACGPQQEPPSGAAPVQAPAAAPDASWLDRNALIGVWSFDRTCASGDGMSLDADGAATFDEWGQGVWRMSEDGQRLILRLDVYDPGDGPTGEREIISIRVTPPVTDELHAEIGGEPPRAIQARRCN